MARVTISVHVRNATQAGLRSVRNSINGLNRGILGALRDTFSDGVGQALATGFQSAMKNPYVAAAIVALVATIASLLGAALAGVLVLAFGAAFVGLAAYMAIQSGKVTKKWDAALKHLKKEFAGAGDALVPTLNHGIDLMTKLGDAFAPHFKKAIQDSAPFLDRFLDQFAQGVQGFGSKAFDPMMKAFNSLLDAFGPQLKGFLNDLGSSFAYLGDTVDKYSKEVGLALRIILEILPGIIYAIGFLAMVWGRNVQVVTQLIGYIKELWGWVSRQWAFTVSAKENGTLLYLIGLCRTLWGWIKRQWDFAVSARGNRSIVTLIDSSRSLWGWVKRQWSFTMSARGNSSIVRLINSARSLWGWIKRQWSFTVSVRGNSSINSVINHLKSLWGWVNRQWSRAVNFNFSLSGPINTIKNLLGMAHGGISGAARSSNSVSRAATGGARGNMTLVGERGPELVNLAPGSHVRSNGDSRRLMGQNQGGREPVVLYLESDDSFMIQYLRKAVRVRGGDVQLVIGSGKRKG